MTKKFNQYIGKAGHLAVMSEFLMRGWNVATPEVDVGDDIFVVKDDDGTLRKIQVKTSSKTERQTSYSGQFLIPLKQLRNISNILIHYVFILRLENTWSKPVIIRQDYMLDLFETGKTGPEHDGNLNLYFSFVDGKIICSENDFTKYVSDFSDFPIIEH
jgi:hypothetical protein